jgi:hypothetical protein
VPSPLDSSPPHLQLRCRSQRWMMLPVATSSGGFGGAAPRCPNSCGVSYSTVPDTTLVQWQARAQCTSPRAGMSSVGASRGAPASPGGSAVGGGEARRAEVCEAGAPDAHVIVHMREPASALWQREGGRPPVGEHGGMSSCRTAGTGAGAARSTEAKQAPPAAGPSREDKALAEATVRITWRVVRAGPLSCTRLPSLYATASYPCVPC